MKNYLLVLMFLCLSELEALNVPFYNVSCINQPQTFNPAFHGMNPKFIGKKQSFEFGSQGIYSSWYTGPSFYYPIFATDRHTINDPTNTGYGMRFTPNATQFNTFFTGRQMLSEDFSLGYGGAINTVELDPYSLSLGMDLGFSLIYQNKKGAYISFGINGKIDNYNYNFMHLDGHISDEKAIVNNMDFGFAYLSKNKLFSAGLSCFNINKFNIIQQEYSGLFEGPYTYMILQYDRQFLLSLKKSSQLNKRKTLYLDYSLLVNMSQYDAIDIDDMTAILGVNKYINGKSIGAGLSMRDFYYNVGPPNWGPYLKFGNKKLDILYSYNFIYSYLPVSSGMHNLGVKFGF